MTSRALRDTLIEHLADAARVADGVDGRSVLPAELREHLADDEAALAEWRRLLGQARALLALGRVPAPGDLEGRVVAALHPGHRQDRIVAQLCALRVQETPDELDVRVRHMAEQPFTAPRKSAPAILDRLVEEEVADLQKSVAARMASRLETRRAPGDLLRRLEQVDPTRHERQERRGSRLLPVAALMVVAGLAWNFVGDSQRQRGGTPAPERAYDFEIVRVDTLEGLRSGEIRSALDGLGGGWLGGVD